MSEARIEIGGLMRDREHDHDDNRNDDTTIIVNVEEDDDDDKNKDGNAWLVNAIVRQADRIIDVLVHQTDRIINHIQKAEQNIMANLDALTAAVANETTVDQSIIVLLDGIAQQLSDLIAAGIVDPAALQALVDQITTNSADISAAVLEHTVVVPPPVEPTNANPV